MTIASSVEAERNDWRGPRRPQRRAQLPLCLIVRSTARRAHRAVPRGSTRACDRIVLGHGGGQKPQPSVGAVGLCVGAHR